MVLRSEICAWLSAALLVPSLFAQPTPEAAAFFENEVRPILKSNCLPCHDDQKRTSGLSFSSRESILAGGNRGAAVKPGNLPESLLVRAIEQTGDVKMPPGRKLQPAEIAIMRRWVELGVPWPRDGAAAAKPKGA